MLLSYCPALHTFIQLFTFDPGYDKHYGLHFTVAYRELELVLFISGHKWPPAFDPLLFEDGDHGHLSFICHHINAALLGGLRTTWETVQVQLNCTYKRDIIEHDGNNKEVVDGQRSNELHCKMYRKPNVSINDCSPHLRSRPLRNGQRPTLAD